MKPPLLDRIARGDILVADGAMGSLLMARGLRSGDPPEEWNLSRPEQLEEVARLYFEAGADLVQTNSFGGSPIKLAEYGLDDRCEEINRRAAEIASGVVGDRAYVSASVGPCGKLLAPYGEADPEEVEEGFHRQVAALASGGAELICVETMTDLAEARLAISAAKSAAPDLPVLATMTFDFTPRGFFTIMGQDVSMAAEGLSEAGADLVGSNCGNGAERMLEVARAFREACELPLIFQANAGLPELEGGKVVYRETPEFMAKLASDMIHAGAQIVGGCCGTGPDHIRAFRAAVDTLEKP